MQQNQPQNTITAIRNGAISAMGKVNDLITSAVYGDNGRPVPIRVPLSEVGEDERSRKRLKTTHKPQLQKLSSTDEIESDEDDVLSTAVLRHDAPHRLNGKTIPSVRLASSAALHRPGLLRHVSSEHQNLEKMMDSSLYARSRSRPPKPASQPQYRGQGTTSIDLTGNDTLPKPSYRGTARPSAQARVRPHKQRVGNANTSDIQSRYFADSSQSKNGSRNPYPPETLPRPVHVHPGSQSCKLSDTFVSTDGIRRNSQSGISSDELAATSPIDEYTTVSRVSPQKKYKRAIDSPRDREQQIDVMAQEEDALGLEPSNIKPTKFTDSVTKAEVIKPQSKSGARKPTKPLDGFECSAIVVDSSYVESGQHGLGLVFDDKRDRCDIYHNGQNLSENNIGLYIPLSKIARIFRSRNSSVVQLLFSRGDLYPSKTVVNFASESLATNFVQKIQAMQLTIRIFDQDG